MSNYEFYVFIVFKFFFEDLCILKYWNNYFWGVWFEGNMGIEKEGKGIYVCMEDFSFEYMF